MTDKQLFRYSWEIPREEQTLLEFIDEMEMCLCSHNAPTVPRQSIEGWMDALKTRAEKDLEQQEMIARGIRESVGRMRQIVEEGSLIGKCVTVASRMWRTREKR